MDAFHNSHSTNIDIISHKEIFIILNNLLIRRTTIERRAWSNQELSGATELTIIQPRCNYSCN